MGLLLRRHYNDKERAEKPGPTPKPEPKKVVKKTPTKKG